MAVSIINEMIRNEDRMKENESEEEIEKKSIEEIKQDCELNASRRLIPKFRESYPRLPVRIIADSLYPSISLISIPKFLLLNSFTNSIAEDEKVLLVIKIPFLQSLIKILDKNFSISNLLVFDQ